MNYAPRTDPVVALKMVRDYLAGHELIRLTLPAFQEASGLPNSTLQRLLARCGTSWRAERFAARSKRLEEILSEGARIDTAAAAKTCGYADTQRFLLFFQKVKGQTYTQYRMGRQL